jgi:peptide/nickel transport system permease protein
MYRNYVLKRLFFGLLMYVVMVFTFSALFNSVAETTLRSQIEEQVSQETRNLKNQSAETIKAYTEQRIANKIHQYHLDEPYLARVLWRSVDTLTFNFRNSNGMKASNGDRQVLGILLEAVPNTLTLFLTEVILVLIIGVPMGLWAARKPNGLLDRSVSMVTMVTNGLPTFWLGMIMIMVFSYAVWPHFPSGGLHSNPAPEGLAYVGDFLWHLALPLLTLTFLSVWGTAYLTRNIVLSNLQEDYIMSARARGIPEAKVLLGHTLRSSMPAIMTLAVLSLFSSISGNIIVEAVFGWPGIGNLYFVAVQQNDVPVLMATLSIQTLINMLGFVLLDIIYGLLDPRIKVGGKA